MVRSRSTPKSEPLNTEMQNGLIINRGNNSDMTEQHYTELTIKNPEKEVPKFVNGMKLKFERRSSQIASEETSSSTPSTSIKSRLRSSRSSSVIMADNEKRTSISRKQKLDALEKSLDSHTPDASYPDLQGAALESNQAFEKEVSKDVIEHETETMTKSEPRTEKPPKLKPSKTVGKLSNSSEINSCEKESNDKSATHLKKTTADIADIPNKDPEPSNETEVVLSTKTYVSTNMASAEMASPSSTSVSTKTAHSIILAQAIKSNDEEKVASLIKEITDNEVIHNTIKNLPVSSLLPFLRIFSDVMRRGKESNLLPWMVWLRYVISLHSSYLTTISDLDRQIGPLLDWMHRRTKNLNKLMQLQGKLQMIADSMASRSEPIRCAQKGVITFIASKAGPSKESSSDEESMDEHDETQSTEDENEEDDSGVGDEAKKRKRQAKGTKRRHSQTQPDPKPTP